MRGEPADLKCRSRAYEFAIVSVAVALDIRRRASRCAPWRLGGRDGRGRRIRAVLAGPAGPNADAWQRRRSCGRGARSRCRGIGTRSELLRRTVVRALHLAGSGRMSERSVGTPLPRIDGHAKVTGAGPIRGRIQSANQSVRVVVGSTIGLGRITGIDAGAGAENARRRGGSQPRQRSAPAVPRAPRLRRSRPLASGCMFCRMTRCGSSAIRSRWRSLTHSIRPNAPRPRFGSAMRRNTPAVADGRTGSGCHRARRGAEGAGRVLADTRRGDPTPCIRQATDANRRLVRYRFVSITIR